MLPDYITCQILQDMDTIYRIISHFPFKHYVFHRYGAGAVARWYYWKVKPDELTVWTHFFPWISYCGHQIFIWATIYYAQIQKVSGANKLCHMFCNTQIAA